MFQQYVENVRKRGLPLIRSKYGLFGLVIFMAILLPGTCIYAGIKLSWLALQYLIALSTYQYCQFCSYLQVKGGHHENVIILEVL